MNLKLIKLIAKSFVEVMIKIRPIVLFSCSQFWMS
jgi:hypothetical protein